MSGLVHRRDAASPTLFKSSGQYFTQKTELATVEAVARAFDHSPVGRVDHLRVERPTARSGARTVSLLGASAAFTALIARYEIDDDPETADLTPERPLGRAFLQSAQRGERLDPSDLVNWASRVVLDRWLSEVDRLLGLGCWGRPLPEIAELAASATIQGALRRWKVFFQLGVKEFPLPATLRLAGRSADDSSPRSLRPLKSAAPWTAENTELAEWVERVIAFGGLAPHDLGRCTLRSEGLTPWWPPAEGSGSAMQDTATELARERLVQFYRQYSAWDPPQGGHPRSGQQSTYWILLETLVDQNLPTFEIRRRIAAAGAPVPAGFTKDVQRLRARHPLEL